MAVRVVSGSRLHLGFYNILTEGVAYGGIGVALENPRIEIKALEIESGIEVVDKTELGLDEVARRVIEVLGVDGVSVVIERGIPPHVGLGSTTQLVLATAYAVAQVKGIEIDPYEIAAKMGRGYVSGIGIATFLYGGLIVDSGVSRESLKLAEVDPSAIPRPLLRLDVPEEWRFVLVTPPGKGLSDEEERKALENPVQLPVEKRAELLECLVLGILRGVALRDVEVFGRALTRLQRIVGEYFSEYQGGVFAYGRGEEIASILRDCGASGVGQSSWGPLIYGVVGSPSQADKTARCVEKALREASIDADVDIAKPRNRGFEIEAL